MVPCDCNLLGTKHSCTAVRDIVGLVQVDTIRGTRGTKPKRIVAS